MIGVYQMPTRVLIAKVITILGKETAISNKPNVSGSLKNAKCYAKHWAQKQSWIYDEECEGNSNILLAKASCKQKIQHILL